MAAFVAANHPGATPEAAAHATAQLLQATTASFDLLSPFCEAAGRGSPAALLAAEAPPPEGSAAAALAYAFGAERLGAMAPDRNGAAHPGELAAAEAFARRAQRAMLAAGLPAGADAGAVRVAVTVHVALDTFIYSQPTIYRAEMAAGECGSWASMLRRGAMLGGSLSAAASRLGDPVHPALLAPPQAASGWCTATASRTGSSTSRVSTLTSQLTADWLRLGRAASATPAAAPHRTQPTPTTPHSSPLTPPQPSRPQAWRRCASRCPRSIG